MPGPHGFSVSREASDARWDDFLTTTPLGQYQQSSLWARVKAAEGWECARVLAERGGGVIGGAQVLFRLSRFGRIGYLSKGPVLAPGEEGLLPELLSALHDLCRSLALRAWLLQPPDEALWQMDALKRYAYTPAHGMGVIDATLLLDLERPWETVLGNVRRRFREYSRQALRRGVSIRVGSGFDMDTFFNLMLQTCRRQGVDPNPSSATVLDELWRVFERSGRVRLTLGEAGGEVVAGVLCLVFGKRVTLWKKGWNSSSNRLHPNEMLYLEAIKWAWEGGYRHFDVSAVDRGIAEALLRGDPLDEQQARSRHVFHLALGGQPVLLPPAMMFIANPFMRGAYRVAMQSTVFRRLFDRCTGALRRH